MAFDPISLFIIVSGAVSARAQSNAAKAQEIELEQAADQEKVSAEGRELARRQKLNKVLASNAVAQVASGATGEGTPESIALASAKQASISEGLEGLSSRSKQAQLKRRAKNTGSAGNIQAASTLLNTGVKVGQLD